MELSTARDAKKFIDDAVASGKMSEEVHKSLSSYLEKKMHCDLTNWSERFCSGQDDVDQQTTHIAAHYVATSYFKMPPDLDAPFVKYNQLDDACGELATSIQPTNNLLEDLEDNLKWPLILKFLKEDEVPDHVLEKEKEMGKAKKPKPSDAKR